MTKQNDSNFLETQQFRQPIIWAIMIPISLFLLGHFGMGVIEPVFFEEHNEHTPGTFSILARSMSLVIGLGLPILLYKIKLITEVTDEGIDIYFYPFKHEVILFKDIASAEARTYTPFTEYGGWGIRQGPSGHAYNVSGNQGVQLELPEDKKLLIGSQRPEELAKIIQANQDQL